MANPASTLTDLVRYAAEIEEFLAVVKGAGSLAVGASEPTPDIKISHSGRHYTWAGSTIKRDS